MPFVGVKVGTKSILPPPTSDDIASGESQIPVQSQTSSRISRIYTPSGSPLKKETGYPIYSMVKSPFSRDPLARVPSSTRILGMGHGVPL